MKHKKSSSNYLMCERKTIYFLLMITSGMMGAYTFNIRGGVFCNAQTANFVMMAIALGKGKFMEGIYYLIPATAYFIGAFVSEFVPNPVKKLKFLRWDTYLIFLEIITLFAIGFIPLSLPNQIVQILINFIASMQYNTFRQAEGIPMATTFCTNHVRQIGVAFSNAVRKKDLRLLKKADAHIKMILSFITGGIVLTVSCKYLNEKAIWIAIIPLMFVLAEFIYADLVLESDKLSRKPSGH